MDIPNKRTILLILVSLFTSASSIAGSSINQSVEVESYNFFENIPRKNNSDSYSIKNEFILNKNIKINLLDINGKVQKLISPNRKNWYKAINPNKIPVRLEINIKNVEKVALFDNLAEFSCASGNHPILIMHSNFHANDSPRSIKVNIKSPCLRYYSQYGRCPQEAVLMVRVKTKNGRYFYNTKRIYTCLLSGTS